MINQSSSLYWTSISNETFKCCHREKISFGAIDRVERCKSQTGICSEHLSEKKVNMFAKQSLREKVNTCVFQTELKTFFQKQPKLKYFNL